MTRLKLTGSGVKSSSLPSLPRRLAGSRYFALSRFLCAHQSLQANIRKGLIRYLVVVVELSRRGMTVRQIFCRCCKMETLSVAHRAGRGRCFQTESGCSSVGVAASVLQGSLNAAASLLAAAYNSFIQHPTSHCNIVLQDFFDLNPISQLAVVVTRNKATDCTKYASC